MGWSVSKVIQETASATDPSKQIKLLDLVKKYKYETKLVVYNVSRFSRNVSKGIALANRMSDGNLILISATEMLDITTPSGQYNFITLLNAAEHESKMIGKRVSDALKKTKEDGNDLGVAPFGFKAVEVDGRRKFVEDLKESTIIQFIAKCRTVGTTVEDLNKSLMMIADEQDFAPLILSRDKDKIISPLSYSNIASILNEYHIKKRGKRWKKEAVSRICNHQVAKKSVGF